MKKTDNEIKLEAIYQVPVGQVWEALTELDRMQKWFFSNIPNFTATIGFKTEFAVQSEDRLFIHLWEIIDVVVEKRISYRWRYRDYDGDSHVIFELEELTHGTRLCLRVRILEDFPDSIPEFRRESCITGWEYFLQSSLKSHLEP